MLLPSIFGAFSTTAISAETFCKIIQNMFAACICAISLPRKRKVTFTLSPFGEKFSRCIDLCLQVICINVRRKTNFLDVDCFLLFLSFFLFTGQLITIFTVVDNLAYRRLCLSARSLQDQVSASWPSSYASLADMIPSCCSVCADQTYLSVSDLFVNH